MIPLTRQGLLGAPSHPPEGSIYQKSKELAKSVGGEMPTARGGTRAASGIAMCLGRSDCNLPDRVTAPFNPFEDGNEDHVIAPWPVRQVGRG
jgi:hypothetical protein